MGHSAKMRHRRRRRHSWMSEQEHNRVARIEAAVLEEMGKPKGQLSKKELNLLRARVKA